MSLSPLADPLTSALFLHHRERASPELLGRLVPVPIPGTRVITQPNFKVMKAKIRHKSRVNNVVPLPVKAVIAEKQPEKIPLSLISDEVCKFYRVFRTHLVPGARDARYMRPRHVAIYLCRELANATYPEIKRHLGYGDHTSVMHGFRKMEAQVKLDERLRDEIDVLTLRILTMQRYAA